MLPFHVRPAQPSERRLVVATWHQHARQKGWTDQDKRRDGRWLRVPDAACWVFVGPRRFGLALNLPTWRQLHSLLVDTILERSTTVIAVHPEVPSQPLGWAVYEPGVLHFVWTDPDFRRQGVATALLDYVLAQIGPKHATSHRTEDGTALLDAYRRRAATVGLSPVERSDGQQQATPPQ